MTSVSQGGLELTTHVRGKPATAELPIVIRNGASSMTA